MQDTIFYILDDIRNVLRSIKYDELELILQAILKAKHVFCLAAGRSRFILSTFCMRLRHLGLDAYILGDLYCPPVEKGDVLFIASGSGNTTSVLALSDECKKLETNIFLFTSNLDSPLAKLSDQIVYIRSSSSLSFDQGEQVMRSLFEQVLFILCESLVKELASSFEPIVISARHANVE